MKCQNCNKIIYSESLIGSDYDHDNNKVDTNTNNYI